MARSRVAAKAAKRRKFTPEMWDYAITHLRDDGWTFGQSCGRAEARRDPDGLQGNARPGVLPP